MIRAITLTALTVLLSACQSAPVRIETVEVKVPVKVACIDKAPAAPTYKTGTGPYPGEREALSILAADFEAAKAYGRLWEVAATGCTSP